jgi:hypothetical protein
MTGVLKIQVFPIAAPRPSATLKAYHASGKHSELRYIRATAQQEMVFRTSPTRSSGHLLANLGLGPVLEIGAQVTVAGASKRLPD